MQWPLSRVGAAQHCLVLEEVLVSEHGNLLAVLDLIELEIVGRHRPVPFAPTTGVAFNCPHSDVDQIVQIPNITELLFVDGVALALHLEHVVQWRLGQLGRLGRPVHRSVVIRGCCRSWLGQATE